MLQWPWVMQMKSSRLFEIVYRLLSSGRCTAPELAQKLEVSVRTIYRDIEALCQAGVPIVTEQGKSGGIRLMEITYDQRRPESWQATANAIGALAREYEGRMFVGAGTVTSPELVELLAQKILERLEH